MRRSRAKARLALALASLALAASSFAATGAQAVCIVNPINGGCLNACPRVLEKFNIYCLA